MILHVGGVAPGMYLHKKKSSFFSRLFLKVVKKSSEPLLLPKLEKYSEEQLFWLAYSGTWCGEQSDAELKLVAANIDNHSPGKFRVLGPVTQSAQFSEDWGCPANSPMNPANKCDLW